MLSYISKYLCRQSLRNIECIPNILVVQISVFQSKNFCLTEGVECVTVFSEFSKENFLFIQKVNKNPPIKCLCAEECELENILAFIKMYLKNMHQFGVESDFCYSVCKSSGYVLKYLHLFFAGIFLRIPLTI